MLYFILLRVGISPQSGEEGKNEGVLYFFGKVLNSQGEGNQGNALIQSYGRNLLFLTKRNSCARKPEILR